MNPTTITTPLLMQAAQRGLQDAPPIDVSSNVLVALAFLVGFALFMAVAAILK